LAELKPRQLSGKPFKSRKLLALYGRYAILRLISGYSSPENCFIVKPETFSQFRKYLLNPPKSWVHNFLYSHFKNSRTSTQARRL
jgi:hypothetical protein